MGKIIDRIRERAIEARRIKLLKEQMNQPLVLEVQPVDRSRAARKERVSVCEALGLEPWADLDKAIIPAIEGLKAAVRQPFDELLKECRTAANSRCGDAILNAKDLVAYIVVQKACLDGERQAMKMVRDTLSLPKQANVFDVVREIQRLQQCDKLKPSDLRA